MRDGYCYYETKCMFAHGTFDVRAVEQNVKEGLTSEERVKRFQTKSIIMLKQKTRKEQPPSFQDAIVQCVENEKPRHTVSMTSPTTPPTQCASNAEHPATPPTRFSLAPSEYLPVVVGGKKSARFPTDSPNDAIIDIFSDATPDSRQDTPHVVDFTPSTKYGYFSEPPSLNGSLTGGAPYPTYSYPASFANPYGMQPYGAGYDYTGHYAATTPQSYCECASCHEHNRSLSMSMSQSFTDDTAPSPVYYSSNCV
jgi:hypothetical protein